MLADERLLDLKRALRLDGLLALALPGATALAMAMVLCGLARRLLRRGRSVGRAQRQHGGNDQQFLNRQTQTASPQGNLGPKSSDVRFTRSRKSGAIGTRWRKFSPVGSIGTSSHVWMPEGQYFVVQLRITEVQWNQSLRIAVPAIHRRVRRERRRNRLKTPKRGGALLQL